MKKRIFSVLLLVGIFIMCSMSAFAGEIVSLPVVGEESSSGTPSATGSALSVPRLIDHTGILSYDDISYFCGELDSVSAEHSCDVAVILTDTLHGFSAEEYADLQYTTYVYGYSDGVSEERNCVLLVISTGEREWWIKKSGQARYDVDSVHIGDQMLDYLSDGDYASAIETFIYECDSQLGGVRTSETQGDDSTSWLWGPGSVLFGTGGSYAYMNGQKKKLRSVGKKRSAGGYTRSGSLNVASRNDTFLYSQVSRSARVKNTSSGGSYSGSSGGGRRSDYGSKGSGGRF